MNGLVPDQRARFSELLNIMVDAGLCRAPLCVMTPLPYIPVTYALMGTTCQVFQEKEDAFASTIASTFALMGIGVPALVSMDGCTDIGNAVGGRQLASDNTGVSLKVKIKSDTKEAIDQITRACDDPNEFAAKYKESVAANSDFDSPPMDPANIKREAVVTPKGKAMKVLDVTMLDSYPASMFKNPAAKPGEPLPGLAAVDPVTGAIGPIKAPATAGKPPPLPPPPPVCENNNNKTSRMLLEQSELYPVEDGARLLDSDIAQTVVQTDGLLITAGTSF